MADRIAFIGTGDPDGDGYAMAYRHASGYSRLNGCELVACADLIPENAEAFAAANDIDSEQAYEDFETMLSEADPDIVSVCVPPVAHADVVTTAAESGIVDAIHCEKPVALRWGDAKEMADTCENADVQLTINHQLRFGEPYRGAKRLLDQGKVGELRRIELRDEHLYDTGTHAFNIVNYYADNVPVDWVIGQVDYTKENKLFGAHNENQAIAQWRYENGVYGLASTGRGEPFVGALFRLLGSDGMITVGAKGTLSYRRNGDSWTTVNTGQDGRYQPNPGYLRTAAETAVGKLSTRFADRIQRPSYTTRAIREVVSAYRNGEQSELDISFALASDELIFATWESSRRHGRVNLPLEMSDNPLEAMVEDGTLNPEPSRPDETERTNERQSLSSQLFEYLR